MFDHPGGDWHSERGSMTLLFPPQPGVGPAILRRGGGSTVSRPFETNGARQSGAHFPKQGVNHFSLYEQ